MKSKEIISMIVCCAIGSAIGMFLATIFIGIIKLIWQQ
jgi:hypothetical protein